MAKRPSTPGDSGISTPADRFAQIIGAVEEAAEKVIGETEEQARDYLADTQAKADQAAAERLALVDDLAAGLVEQAERVRQESDRLLEALKGATGKVSRPLKAIQLVPSEKQSEKAKQEGGDATNGDALPESADPRAPADPQAHLAGARLLVAQMAISGSSRTEIEGRLHDELGVEEAKPLLDAILGPED